MKRDSAECASATGTGRRQNERSQRDNESFPFSLWRFGMCAARNNDDDAIGTHSRTSTVAVGCLSVRACVSVSQQNANIFLSNDSFN